MSPATVVIPAVGARFKPGDRIRVREIDPPGHVRTPAYIRGKSGWIEHLHGAFPDPAELAYALDARHRPLYLVGFRQADLWPCYSGSPNDTLLVDLYEHWLEPA